MQALSIRRHHAIRRAGGHPLVPDPTVNRHCHSATTMWSRKAPRPEHRPSGDVAGAMAPRVHHANANAHG
jgi:hypothetical protein